MKMGTKIFFFISILLLTVIGFIDAQNRYALIIGNNNYESIERLVNPTNDATDVAAKLRTLGYQVELQTNIGKVAMDRAVQNYIQRLALNKDNEGFFWFAGHGVQIDGENYLLPIDVDSTDDLSVKHTSYSVNLLTESFDKRARNKVNVVVLDACRNNPFRNLSGGNRSLTRGLRVISEQDIPPDLLIIYSTAAGTVAQDGTGQRNSPFAEAFIQNMDRNEDITIVVRGISRETLRLTNNKQEPFIGGRIISLDYYSLNPQKTLPTPVPSVQPVYSRNIMGVGSLTLNNVIAYITSKGSSLANQQIQSIIRTYIEEARIEGINHDIAIAQMLYATNFLTNQQLLNTYNFAGLNSARGISIRNGNFHTSLIEGIRAHIQHLKGYASTELPKLELVDSQYQRLKTNGTLGTIRTLNELYRVWSEASDYGNNIDKILRELYQFNN